MSELKLLRLKRRWRPPDQVGINSGRRYVVGKSAGLKSGLYKCGGKNTGLPARNRDAQNAKNRPLHNSLHRFSFKFFVGKFFVGGFSSWFVLGAGESVFEHFGDAAVAGFGGAGVEDAEQMVAALKGSHGLPALIGARISSEGALEDGGQVELGFHGGEQLLCDLLGAADAGFGAFYADDPIADPFAHGKAECVEPAAEPAVLLEDALEFSGDDGDAFCSVRFEAKVRGVADGGVAPGLQTLFDEHALVALAGGEDPSA